MVFAIGDAVYKSYAPATVGLVVKIEVKAWDFAIQGMKPHVVEVPVLTVRQASGKTYEIPQGYGESYRALIEDHRRKLERHEAALVKLLNAS